MEQVAESAKEKKKINGLLVLASSRGYLGDIEELIERGAEVTAKDKKGVSALHYAAGQGRLEVIKFLYSKGVDLDSDDPGGRTPLHWAVLGNQTAAVSFLLAKGAWVEASDAHDDTPLHLAARAGSKEVVIAMLDAAAVGRHPSIKDVNKRGLTPLGESLAAGRADIAELLISKAGGNVLGKPKGWSLLHLAAALGLEPSVKLLLSKGVPVNDVDNEEGLSPLHCTALADSSACAKLLLNAGADLALLTADGRTAFECAPAKNEVLRKLLKTLAPGKPAAKAATHQQEALSPSQTFSVLSHDEQNARILRWADIVDEARLDAALAGLPKEAKKQVTDLRTTMQVLKIQKAIIELHEDEDFQQDACQPRMLGIVDEVRNNAAGIAKYNSDEAVMHVLRKLRRFQMVIAANGHHKVPFVDLIVQGKSEWKEKDQMRLRGMKLMVERQVRAAAAAASADLEAAAKAAAEAELMLPPPPDAAAGSSGGSAPAGLSQPPTGAASAPVSSANGPSNNGPASPEASSSGRRGRQASALKQPAHSSGSGSAAGGSDGRKVKKRVSWKRGCDGGVPDSSAPGNELEGPEALGEKFTWKGLGKAMLRQLYQMAFMCFTLLLAMYLTGQRMPWQPAEADGESAKPEESVFMSSNEIL